MFFIRVGETQDGKLVKSSLASIVLGIFLVLNLESMGSVCQIQP